MTEQRSVHFPRSLPGQANQPAEIGASPRLHQEMPAIVLSQYGRASDTQAHCFFPGCHRTERLVVPLSIRIRLFVDLRFYVPPSCRICHYHLRGNLWQQLTEMDVNHTFTEAYIYDFMTLLKQEKYIDFENIDMMDDHLAYFCLG